MIKIRVSGAMGVGKSYLIRKIADVLNFENYSYEIKYSDGTISKYDAGIGLPRVEITEVNGPVE